MINFYLICLIFLTKFSIAPAKITPGCRSERRIHLSPEIFKLDSCARCYNYMSRSVFKFKFTYDSFTYTLRDIRSNITYIADPLNSSEPLLETFKDNYSIDNWKECCIAAWQCCEEMLAEPPNEKEGLYCPKTWDGWQCWPETPAHRTESQYCQSYIYFETRPPSCKRHSFKTCTSNGTWFRIGDSREWTDYSKCGRREEHRRYMYFHISTYIISMIAIAPALIIFMCYKQLQVHRITMHKNFFFSLLLNCLAMILFKSLVIIKEINRNQFLQSSILGANKAGCKILLIVTKYFRITNYMWMFCEAYYLHRLIAAAFAEQRNLIMFYAIGWGLPIIPVTIYAIIRATLEDEKCWAFPVEQYEWILNVPNLLSLLANVFFICNIIRILLTKLRAAHANEPSQYRKAVRATLVLVPLFGLHFCLVIYRPSNGPCGLLEAYVYLNYTMDGLQGFAVSLIFCYLNGEVLYLLKRSYQRYKIRSTASRRISTTQDFTMNDSHNQNSNRAKYIENKLKEVNDYLKDKSNHNGDSQKRPKLSI